MLDALLLVAEVDNLVIYGPIQVGDVQVWFLAGLRLPCTSSCSVLFVPGSSKGPTADGKP